jgi:hypothetical protein
MVSGSGRYVKYRAVAGAHRPQTSDLTSKKMSPDGLSTCEQYYTPRSQWESFFKRLFEHLRQRQTGAPLTACQDLTAVSNVEMVLRRLTTRDKKCQEYEHLFLALK